MITCPIKWIGNRALLERRKTAFLCSQTTPSSVFPVIQRWAEGLDADMCIVCGNESEVERMVFSIVLRRGIPAILLLSEALNCHFSKKIQSAIEDGRLLVGTHCNDDVHFTTRQSAIDRNRIIIDLSDEVVVGFSSENGEVARSTCHLANVKYITHLGFQPLGSGVQPESYFCVPVRKFPKFSTVFFFSVIVILIILVVTIVVSAVLGVFVGV